jgi:hypothetical protein
MKNILHYGLQRSGTNYLEALLKKNYYVETAFGDPDRNHPLHKHFRLYDNKAYIPEPKFENDLIFDSFSDYERSLGQTVQIDGIVIVSKDPYSWFISYLKWAKKNKWPKVNYHYAEEYNNFYGKWAEFQKNEPRILFVRYIDLLTDSKKELKKAEETFNLSHRPENTDAKSTIKKVPQSRRFTDKKYKFYTEKKYLRKISKAELKRINSILDVQLMAELNYEFERSV